MKTYVALLFVKVKAEDDGQAADALAESLRELGDSNPRLEFDWQYVDNSSLRRLSDTFANVPEGELAEAFAYGAPVKF